MTDPTYPYKLRIARMAYKQVKAAIEAVEGRDTLIDIYCHWDECITVDDELFHGHQLREKDKDAP